jgi:16S rRNA (cytidine1402-2'-O)-methyltransferase
LERTFAALAQGEVAWLVMELDELAEPARRLARALLGRGVELVAVPGASTMVAGLVASGLPADRFTALGVLPASLGERETLWKRFAADPLTVVCGVRDQELGEVLSEALAHLGDRRIAVSLTNEVWRGQMSEGLTLDWNGDVTLVIEGAGSEPDWTSERVLDEVRARLDAGTSPRDTAREVARRSGWSKRQVYEWALRVSRDEA